MLVKQLCLIHSGLLWPGYTQSNKEDTRFHAASTAKQQYRLLECLCPGAIPPVSPSLSCHLGKKNLINFFPCQASTQMGERHSGCCGLPHLGESILLQLDTVLPKRQQLVSCTEPHKKYQRWRHGQMKGKLLGHFEAPRLLLFGVPGRKSLKGELFQEQEIPAPWMISHHGA